jgi:RNA polymerase sigma-70 factor, ECF subfamily
MSESAAVTCQRSPYAGQARPSFARKRTNPPSPRNPAASETPRNAKITEALVNRRGVNGAQALLISTIPNLRAFAISLCKDASRADDLVQETLVKAWTNLESFEMGTNFKAWVFTILRNTYFSEIRKRRGEVEDVDGAQAGRQYDLPGQQAAMEFADFAKAFRSLRNDHKEALLLVGAEGFSYTETAEITGVAEGTVKSRVHRARTALTKLLGLDPEENFNPNAEFVGLVGRTSGSREFL